VIPENSSSSRSGSNLRPAFSEQLREALTKLVTRPGYNSKLSPSPLQGSKNSVFRNAQNTLSLVLSLPAHQEPKACVPLQWAHYPLRSPSGSLSVRMMSRSTCVSMREF